MPDARIAGARERALAFIAENLEDIGVDSADDLRETGAHADPDSVSFRFQQFFAELPVLSAELLLEVFDDADEEPEVLLNKLRGAISVDAQPTITSEDAVQRSSREGATRLGAPELLVVAKGAFGRLSPVTDRLVWCVNLCLAPTTQHAFYVDAQTGEILADHEEPVRAGAE
jgi:hypothetical protein